MNNPYKLAYHIEPATGLLNDPNGLIKFKDTFYFFHQWNRFSTDHSYKEWGMFTSNDMVHWSSHGSAIIPDRDIDKNGVYSGSAVEYNEKMYLYYTGNVKKEMRRKSYQCISISEDGRTFIKQANAIETPEEYTENFRDPKVWKGTENWWMIVGAQTKELRGAVALFSSENLLEWNYENILYDVGLDNMCECPDLISINEDIDILLCCPQKITEAGSTTQVSSYSAFLAGKFNEDTQSFHTDMDLELMDQGFDFYAPQTFMDNQGRRIVVAWMSRMTDEEELLCPTNKLFNYLHCLTLPRVLTWEDNMLKQKPITELKKLRKKKEQYDLPENTFELESGHFEIHLIRTHTHSDFDIQLRNKAITINYNSKNQVLFVERENWVSHKREYKSKQVKQLKSLQLYSDNSTIEIFINDGESVFSMRYFTQEANLTAHYKGLKQGEILNYYPF